MVVSSYHSLVAWLLLMPLPSPKSHDGLYLSVVIHLFLGFMKIMGYNPKAN